MSIMLTHIRKFEKIVLFPNIKSHTCTSNECECWFCFITQFFKTSLFPYSLQYTSSFRTFSVQEICEFYDNTIFQKLQSYLWWYFSEFKFCIHRETVITHSILISIRSLVVDTLLHEFNVSLAQTSLTPISSSGFMSAFNQLPSYLKCSTLSIGNFNYILLTFVCSLPLSWSNVR